MPYFDFMASETVRYKTGRVEAPSAEEARRKVEAMDMDGVELWDDPEYDDFQVEILPSDPALDGFVEIVGGDYVLDEGGAWVCEEEREIVPEAMQVSGDIVLL
jgi:hypothetical protein